MLQVHHVMPHHLGFSQKHEGMPATPGGNSLLKLNSYHTASVNFMGFAELEAATATPPLKSGLEDTNFFSSTSTASNTLHGVPMSTSTCTAQSARA